MFHATITEPRESSSAHTILMNSALSRSVTADTCMYRFLFVEAKWPPQPDLATVEGGITLNWCTYVHPDLGGIFLYIQRRQQQQQQLQYGSALLDLSIDRFFMCVMKPQEFTFDPNTC